MSAGKVNPHNALPCRECHSQIPLKGQTGPVNPEGESPCLKCHAQGSGPHHVTVSDRSSKTCTDCHASHGTEDTVYYLKKNFVLAQPPEINPHKDEKSCTLCHKNRPAEGQPADFLYSGNLTVLCTGCHWSRNFMHPMEVVIPPRLLTPKKLPFSAEKKITCQTCHDSCTKHQVKEPGLLRLYPEYKSRNDQCFECHPRGKYAKVNPHQEQHNRERCLYCHDHDVRLSYRTLGSRNTLKTTEHLLCLRCHLLRDIPGFSTHTLHQNIAPVRLTMPPEFKLDKQGRLTCSTCHNPHFWEGNKSPWRGELPRDRFCRNCHPDL